MDGLDESNKIEICINTFCIILYTVGTAFFCSIFTCLIYTVSHFMLTAYINSDLDRRAIRQSYLRFHVSKIQYTHVSHSRIPHDFPSSFVVPPLDSVNILGITVTPNLSWKPHISQLAKSTSKTKWATYRCWKFFCFQQLQRSHSSLHGVLLHTWL